MDRDIKTQRNYDSDKSSSMHRQRERSSNSFSNNHASGKNHNFNYNNGHNNNNNNNGHQVRKRRRPSCDSENDNDIDDILKLDPLDRCVSPYTNNINSNCNQNQNFNHNNQKHQIQKIQNHNNNFKQNNNNNWYNKKQRFNNGKNNNNRPPNFLQQRINELQERLLQKDIQLKDTRVIVMNRESDIAELRNQHERDLLEIEVGHTRIKELQIKEIDLIQIHKDEVTKLKLALENKRDIITKLRKDLEDAQNDISLTRAILETTNNRNVELNGRINELIDIKKKNKSNKRIQTDQNLVTVETQVNLKIENEDPEIDKEAKKSSMSPPQSTVVHSTTKPDNLPNMQNFYSRRSDHLNHQHSMVDRLNRNDSLDSGCSLARSESYDSQISREFDIHLNDPHRSAHDTTKFPLMSLNSFPRDSVHKASDLLKLIYKKSPRNPEKQNLTINIDGTKSDDYVMVDYIESPDEMPGKNLMESRSDFRSSRENLEISRDYFVGPIEKMREFKDRVVVSVDPMGADLANLIKFGELLEDSEEIPRNSRDSLNSSTENLDNVGNFTEKKSRREVIKSTDILKDFQEIIEKSKETFGNSMEILLEVPSEKLEISPNSRQISNKVTTFSDQTIKLAHEVPKNVDKNSTGFELFSKSLEESSKNLLKKFSIGQEIVDIPNGLTTPNKISISKEIFKSPAKSYELSPKIHNIPPSSQNSRRSSSDLSKDLSGSTGNLSVTSELQDFLNLSESEPAEEPYKGTPIRQEDFHEFAQKFNEKFKLNKMQKAARESLHLPIAPCYINDLQNSRKTSESVVKRNEYVNTSNNFPNDKNLLSNQNSDLVSQSEQRSNSNDHHEATNKTDTKFDKNKKQLQNGIKNNREEVDSALIPSTNIKQESDVDVSENETDIDEYHDSVVRSLIKRGSDNESDDGNSSVSSIASNKGANDDDINSTDKAMADKNVIDKKLRGDIDAAAKKLNFICSNDKSQKLKVQGHKEGDCGKIDELNSTKKSLSEEYTHTEPVIAAAIADNNKNFVSAELKDLEETIKILEGGSENSSKERAKSDETLKVTCEDLSKKRVILTKIDEKSKVSCENAVTTPEKLIMDAKNSPKASQKRGSSESSDLIKKIIERLAECSESEAEIDQDGGLGFISTAREDSIKETIVTRENVAERDQNLTKNSKEKGFSSQLSQKFRNLVNNLDMDEKSNKTEKQEDLAQKLDISQNKTTPLMTSTHSLAIKTIDSTNLIEISNIIEKSANLLDIPPKPAQNLSNFPHSPTNTTPNAVFWQQSHSSATESSAISSTTTFFPQNSSTLNKNPTYSPQTPSTSTQTPKKVQKIEDACPTYLHSFQDFLTVRCVPKASNPSKTDKKKRDQQTKSDENLKTAPIIQSTTEISKEEQDKLELERNRREKCQKEFQQKQHSKCKIIKRRESILVDMVRSRREKIETRSGSKMKKEKELRQIEAYNVTKYSEKSDKLNMNGNKNPELENENAKLKDNQVKFSQQISANCSQLKIIDGQLETSETQLRSTNCQVGSSSNQNKFVSNQEKIESFRVDLNNLKDNQATMDSNQGRSIERYSSASTNENNSQPIRNQIEKPQNNNLENQKNYQSSPTETPNQPQIYFNSQAEVTKVNFQQIKNQVEMMKNLKKSTENATSESEIEKFQSEYAKYKSDFEKMQTEYSETLAECTRRQEEFVRTQMELLNSPQKSTLSQAESLSNVKDKTSESATKLMELTNKNIESSEMAPVSKLYYAEYSANQQDPRKMQDDSEKITQSNQVTFGRFKDYEKPQDDFIGNVSKFPVNLTKPQGDTGRSPTEFGRSPSSNGKSPGQFGRSPSDSNIPPNNFRRSPPESTIPQNNFGRSDSINPQPEPRNVSPRTQSSPTKKLSPTKNLRSEPPYKKFRQLPSEDEMGVCSQIVATTLKKSQQQREMSRSSEERMMQNGNFQGYSRNEQFYGGDRNMMNDRNDMSNRNNWNGRNDRFDRNNLVNNSMSPNFYGNRFQPRDDRNRRNSTHDFANHRQNNRTMSPRNRRFVDRSISLNTQEDYKNHPKSPKYCRSNSYQEPQFKGNTKPPLNVPFRPNKETTFIHDNPKFQHGRNSLPSPSPSPPPLMIDENNLKRTQNKNEISQIVIAELTVFYELKKFESDNPKELFKSMARAITYHFYDKNPDMVPNKSVIKNYVMEVFYNYGTIRSDKDFLLSEDYDDDGF